LRAIETEEFEKLPGGVFNTNYIRQYADAIGFSVERLIAEHEVFKARSRRRTPSSKRSVWLGGVGLSVG
jgi:cytoskeletal protein RodZ